MKKDILKLSTRSPSTSKHSLKSYSPISNYSSCSLKKRNLSVQPQEKKQNYLVLLNRPKPNLKSLKAPPSPGFKNLILLELEKHNFQENTKPSVLKAKQKEYKEIIDSLFLLSDSLYKICNYYTLCSLFFSLGYTNDLKNLELIFTLSFNLEESGLISKSEIMSICECTNVDILLKILLQSLKDQKKNLKFDEMISSINAWWRKINKHKNGFVSSDEVLFFVLSLTKFDTSLYIQKILSRLGHYLNYSSFIKIFSKSLIKFLILSLIKEKNDPSFISSYFSITEKRRESILNKCAAIVNQKSS